MDFISPEQWEQMTRAERIACCHRQAKHAERAAASAPGDRRELYKGVAKSWRMLATVLGRR